MKVANSNDGEFSSSTRREFLAASVAAVAGLSGIADSVAAQGQSPTAPSRLPGDDRDWSKVHGFNYQPSYGRNGLELWQKFDAGIIEAELTRGKKYFPGINAIEADGSLRPGHEVFNEFQ